MAKQNSFIVDLSVCAKLSPDPARKGKYIFNQELKPNSFVEQTEIEWNIILSNRTKIVWIPKVLFFVLL